MILKFIKLSPDAKEFKYSRVGDACLDMYSNEDSVVIEPHTSKVITTGIAVEVPLGYEGIVRGRSGLATKGILCHVGTIDSNYRGNVGVILFNITNKPYVVSKYDRIGQFSLHTTTQTNLIEVFELSDTNRRDQGYGSS